MAEDAALQMRKDRVAGKAGRDRIGIRYIDILSSGESLGRRQLFYVAHRLSGKVEQRVFPAGVLMRTDPIEPGAVIPAQRERDDDLPAAADQSHDHTVLGRRKTGETVQYETAPSHPVRRGNGLRQKVQHLLVGDEAVSLSLQEGLIEHLQVTQARVQSTLPFSGGVFLHDGKLPVPDPVLHEFGDHGLHFRDHARIVNAPSQDPEIFLALPGDSAQQQSFPCVVQNGPF